MKTGSELRGEVLDEVRNCVCKDRQNTYGDAEDNFNDIADLWTWWLEKRGLLANGKHLEAVDVAVMSGMIKTARMAKNIEHLDNFIDLAGYAVCGAGLIKQRQIQRESHASRVKTHEVEGDHSPAKPGSNGSRK